MTVLEKGKFKIVEYREPPKEGKPEKTPSTRYPIEIICPPGTCPICGTGTPSTQCPTHQKHFMEPKEDTIKKWRNDLEYLNATQRSGGYGPGAGEFLRKFLQKEHQPTIDWKAVLETAISKNCGPIEYSFSRPSRRFATYPFFIPARERIESPCEVAVGIDTSGSMSDEAITGALKEIDEIMELYPKAKREISFQSTALDGPHVLEEGTTFADSGIPIRTTGGTYLSPFFEHYAKDESPNKVLVMFTDLETGPEDFNTTKRVTEDAGLPVFWVTNIEGREAPFGKTLHYRP